MFNTQWALLAVLWIVLVLAVIAAAVGIGFAVEAPYRKQGLAAMIVGLLTLLISAFFIGGFSPH